MNGKQIVWGILLVLAAFAAFGESSSSDEMLSFDLYASDVLFPEAIADPHSSAGKLHVISVLEGQPRTIRVFGTNTYDDVPIYNGDAYASENLYGQVKTGVNLGLFRLRIKNIIAAELTFQGGLNAVFQGFGGADMLGFDGVFFFGVNTELFNTIAFRYGYQHYSGHYGDETLKNVIEHSGSTAEPVEYCKDNNILAGLSLPIGRKLRFYADVSKPLREAWLNPSIHIPAWVIKATSGEPLYIAVANNEGVEPEERPASYNAWIIHSGAEITLPSSFGELFFAGDVKIHQDGQTKHMPGQYAESNPWESEFTIGGGIAFYQNGGNGKARIEAFYHEGRFPLLNFFYQRTQYISVGIAFSS
jgi:hypothetical protein